MAANSKKKKKKKWVINTTKKNSNISHCFLANVMSDKPLFFISLFFFFSHQAKQKKILSQRLQQIGRPDLNAFLFGGSLFWAADVSNLSWSQLCSVWNIQNLIFGWTRYKTEHSWRNLLFKVFYCVYVFSCIFCLFMYILTSKFIKKLSKYMSFSCLYIKLCLNNCV